jgi:hypothetical protein
LRILLDEMWSAEIAVQLRRRGHDVVAITERPELRGQPDAVIFATAQREGRAIVTENVIDFRPQAAIELQFGRSHAGLIFTSNRRFPRHNPSTAGHLVTALHVLLSSGLELKNIEHWLT